MITYDIPTPSGDKKGWDSCTKNETRCIKKSLDCSCVALHCRKEAQTQSDAFKGRLWSEHFKHLRLWSGIMKRINGVLIQETNKHWWVHRRQKQAVNEAEWLFLLDWTRGGWRRCLHKQHSAFAFTLSRKPHIWGLSHSKAAAEAGMLWNTSLLKYLSTRKCTS